MFCILSAFMNIIISRNVMLCTVLFGCWALMSYRCWCYCCCWLLFQQQAKSCSDHWQTEQCRWITYLWKLLWWALSSDCQFFVCRVSYVIFEEVSAILILLVSLLFWLEEGLHQPFRYIASHAGQLSLAIFLWVGTMSARCSWDTNRHAIMMH